MVFAGSLTGGMSNRCKWFLQGGGCFALLIAIGDHRQNDEDNHRQHDQHDQRQHYEHDHDPLQGDLQRLSREVDIWSSECKASRNFTDSPLGLADSLQKEGVSIIREHHH